MNIKAKFTVITKTQYHGGSGNVVLQAVTNTSEENKTFWKYTPSGKIEMGIDNPAAFDALVLGAEYYVTFEKSEKE